MFDMSAEKKSKLGKALRDKMLEVEKRRGNSEATEQAAQESIDRRFETHRDGAEAGSDTEVFDPPSKEPEQPTYTDAQFTPEFMRMLAERANRMQKESARSEQSPAERKPATPCSVDESFANRSSCGSRMSDFVRRMMSGEQPDEPESVKRSKATHAQSKKTEMKPEVEQILYRKNSCESQGRSIEYSVALKKVNWGDAINKNSNSIMDSIEYLSSFLTNAIRDSYGGWGRITEIIVRDQHLIINRTCFFPVIDQKSINPALFPIDTVDYIKEGAIASFFDWGMLKHMRNLRVLDVDDLGFYEVNIGGSLKCGRRIGVSTLFDLCKSLDVLILAGDTVTRESLYTKEATPVKKKLAQHKRFSLFADGYKIEVMKTTNDFSSWATNNMKNYANNKGNKNIFMYCGGCIARGLLAGGAGIINAGTHLIGGVVNMFKEAMHPVDPDEIGLK